MKTKVLFILLFAVVIAHSQTTTTSNIAVFDGGNQSGNDQILVLGSISNGGMFMFDTDATSVRSYVLDRNDKIRMYNNFNPDNTNFGYMDSFGSPSFSFYDIESIGVCLSLDKANSRLIIGGGTDFQTSNKLTVKNGNSYFDGNVGIGTESFVDSSDNEEYKLSVHGKIRAHEVKVYTSWADYVFEEAYNLPTLDEVREFVKEHGHLINMPSAEEVEEKGIQLAEMTRLQQEKIEELTLYVLQLSKKLESQQTLIKALETKVNSSLKQ